MMRLMWITLAAFALSAVAVAADVSAPSGIAVGGQVQSTLKLSIDDLRKMPATDVDVTYTTHHGQETGKFTGVLLWTVLEKAVMVDGAGKGAMLRHVITVTGRDGYAVVLAAGELAPDFANKAVILAMRATASRSSPRKAFASSCRATSVLGVRCATSLPST